MPTAANAAYYAEIVAEKATLRRLVEAGTRIVQLGYHGAEGGEVNDVVDRAQAAIYEVTERSTSEDYVALEELLQPTMDEIDAIASRGGAALGVPTGFADLDAATNGLHPGQMIVVAARPGLGKALALDTPLPTPAGWTTMGDVAVGDFLLGADGRANPRRRRHRDHARPALLRGDVLRRCRTGRRRRAPVVGHHRPQPRPRPPAGLRTRSARDPDHRRARGNPALWR